MSSEKLQTQSPVKLIVIDDSAEWRLLVSSALSALFSNIEIKEADSGQAAVEVLSKSTDFNLVISDLSMPQGDGFSVFKFMQEKGIEIPFLLFTALFDYNLSKFEGPTFAGVVSKTDLGRLKALVTKSLRHLVDGT